MSNAWKAVEEAMNELHRLGHVGKTVETIEHAHRLRNLSDGLLVALTAVTDFDRKLLDLDAENELLRSILRKLKASGASLGEGYLHCGVSVRITVDEAALFDAITTEEPT